MSREASDRLRYFSFDVDLLDNPKIKALRRRLGNSAVLLFIRILCDTYGSENGFFLKYTLDYQDQVREELGIRQGKLNQVMSFLCERSLVDAKLFASDTVITSPEIQRRWQQGVKGRATKRSDSIYVDERFWLLESSETEPFIKFILKSGTSKKNDDNSGKKADNSGKKALNEIKGTKEKDNIVAPRGDVTVPAHPASDFDRKCTDYLIRKCKEGFPNAKVPKTEAELERWQGHMEKLRRLDGQQEAVIWEVLVWTFRSPFWRANIRNTAKFREKFETLYLQSRQAGTGGSRRNSFNDFKQNEYDFEELERELIGR